MVNRWGNNGSSDRLYFGGFKNHCRWRLNWLRLVIAFLPRRVDLQRKLSAKELMLLNCGVGEDSWESLGLHARRSNQSILKEVSPEYSLEGLMLKLQYFGHLMWRTDSREKTLMLGKTEGRRRRGTTEDEMVGWHHWLNGHQFEQTLEDDEG